MLPNGNVLTIDIWDSYPTGNTTNAEQYDPASGTWISAGNTPVPLADPYECGNWEIGPAVMRPDGTLVAFGGNTGCKGVPKPDPTAIYDTANGTWSAGRNIPALCGTGGKTSCSLADAPAALLPSGNILFAASAGAGSQPTHFFEFTSSDTIVQVADTVYCAASEPGYAVNFLVLPERPDSRHGSVQCAGVLHADRRCEGRLGPGHHRSSEEGHSRGFVHDQRNAVQWPVARRLLWR